MSCKYYMWRQPNRELSMSSDPMEIWPSIKKFLYAKLKQILNLIYFGP